MGAKYDQLDLDERIEMSRLYEAGTSRREIGRIIGRSASTVGRELRRNTLPRGGYKPASADRIALSRRRRLSRIERLSPLRSYVCDRLAMGWSPEQIAGRLEREGLRAQHQSRVDLSLHLPPAPAPGEAAPLPAAGQGDARTALFQASQRPDPGPHVHP